MAEQKFKIRDGAGGSAGQTGIINANTEALTADISDLTNVTIYVVQDTDNGTVVLVLEKAIGDLWVPVDASIAEGDFAAGSDAAIEYTLSDANGMPLHADKIRVRATTHTGTGVYSLRVAGLQRPGFA